MGMTKCQRDFVNLALHAARGLEIDVVRKPHRYCGITTALNAARENGSRPFEYVQAVNAWDAVCAFSAHTGTNGNGYFMRIHHALLSLCKRDKARSVCMAFDGVQFMPHQRLLWIAEAAHDARRAANVGLRLILIYGKADVWVGYDAEGRWIGDTIEDYPNIPKPLGAKARVWDWTQRGLVTTKTVQKFSYFDEEVAAEPIALRA